MSSTSIIFGLWVKNWSCSKSLENYAFSWIFAKVVFVKRTKNGKFSVKVYLFSFSPINLSLNWSFFYDEAWDTFSLLRSMCCVMLLSSHFHRELMIGRNYINYATLKAAKIMLNGVLKNEIYKLNQPIPINIKEWRITLVAHRLA